MTIPLYIRRAVRSWLAWRRKREWMRAKGIDTLTTRIKVKEERHQSAESERSKLSEIVHTDIAASLGLDWHPPVKRSLKEVCAEKLRSELHHG